MTVMRQHPVIVAVLLMSAGLIVGGALLLSIPGLLIMPVPSGGEAGAAYVSSLSVEYDDDASGTGILAVLGVVAVVGGLLVCTAAFVATLGNRNEGQADA